MLNKKLINIKNALKIVISVLIIISMVKSCSMAATVQEIGDACRNDIQKLVDKGLLKTDFNVSNIANPLYNDRTYYFIILGNFTRYISGRNQDVERLLVCYTKFNPVKTTWSSQWGNGTNEGLDCISYYTLPNGVTDTKNASTLENSKIKRIDYMYTTTNIQTTNITLNAGEEYGGQYITEPPFTYTPNYTEIITFNNTSDVNALKINSVVIPFDIGEIQQLRRLL